MPLIRTYEELAKLAFTQAVRHQDLPEHFIHDAEWYVEEAIGQMDADGSVDPENYAERLAERAIVEYTKAKLLERDPVTVDEYQAAFTQWFRKAMREWWEDRPAGLAKQVFYETMRETDSILRSHDYDDCETFVEEAVAHLKSRWGYDPETEMPDLGKRPIMDYAVEKMQGNEPLVATSYLEAERRWASSAARFFIGEQPVTLATEAFKLRLAENAIPRKDDLTYAESYVAEAHRYLKESFSYDPEEYAVDAADKFVIDWAVHRLKNEDPTTSRGMSEIGTAWAMNAARDFIDAVQTTTLEQTIATDAFRMLLSEGNFLRMYQWDDAVRYASESEEYLRDLSTWDPVEDGQNSANRARITFVKARLRGVDASLDQETHAAVEQWLKAVARKKEYADTYPDHPRIRTRLRDQSRKKFNPDDVE